MNHETELRLQAWLDGELPSVEAREVAALVERDPAARALWEELRITKGVLKANELERELPATREFYWSQIERQIRQLEAAEAAVPPPRWFSAWLKYGAPAAILTALAVMVTAPNLRLGAPASVTSHAEVDSPLDDISFFTFRSEAEGMTVLWVSNQ